MGRSARTLSSVQNRVSTTRYIGGDLRSGRFVAMALERELNHHREERELLGCELPEIGMLDAPTFGFGGRFLALARSLLQADVRLLVLAPILEFGFGLFTADALEDHLDFPDDAVWRNREMRVGIWILLEEFRAGDLILLRAHGQDKRNRVLITVPMQVLVAPTASALEIFYALM